VSNLEYLTARLHGRRSRMAEGDRLDALTRIRTVEEYARTLFPEKDFQDIADLQRQLVEDLVRELSLIKAQLTHAEAYLVEWMPVRFEAENLKVLLRASITKVNPEEAAAHLVAVPGFKSARIHALAVAGSVMDFLHLLEAGPIRRSLEKAIREHGEDARPFFFEAAIDRGYLTELVARFKALSSRDREDVGNLIRSEADIFHLILMLRGRFNYGLSSDQLLSMHVPGAAIAYSTFADMLNDPDPQTAVNRVVMRVLDPLTFEGGQGEATIPVTVLERLAWHRYLHIARMTFRKSHMGFGAVVAHVAIRRIEIANLITISEGIRSGMDPDAIRMRTIPRSDIEGAHV
jgi:vacuolar-type H+-ATPase subunit C/Vma6